MSYKHLKQWEHPDSYIGATWEGWYPVYGQHRDSGTVTRSNYARILEDLVRNTGDGCEECEDVPVLDTRCSHWAVGWVETIYIHQCDKPSLERADEILEALSDYPVYDEEAYLELEFNEAAEYWERWADMRDKIRIAAEAGLSIFAARHDYSTVLSLDPSGYHIQEACSPDRC